MAVRVRITTGAHRLRSASMLASSRGHPARLVRVLNHVPQHVDKSRYLQNVTSLFLFSNSDNDILCFEPEVNDFEFTSPKEINSSKETLKSRGFKLVHNGRFQISKSHRAKNISLQKFSNLEFHLFNSHDITPWEEEGHKCKNNISGTLAIEALKEASKVHF